MKRTKGAGWRWRRFFRRVRWPLLGLVVILAVLRLYLPVIVKDYVNRQLNRSHDYGGRLGGVGIQLWRGQYTIHSLEIMKRTGGIPVPFFSANRMDLAIQWSELFHGSVVGRVFMHEPHLNFVAGPTADQTQTGTNESWNKVLESLFPFKLNRLEIERGEIHFQNVHASPPVDIYLHEVRATATNFANARVVNSPLPAGVTVNSTTIGGGGLDLKLLINPVAPAPTYQLDAQLTNVDVTALNSFLKAYGKFDVQSGQFALFTSVASKDGNYEGYFKVFFNNLHVFRWEKERDKDVLEIFWQAVVGTLATAFKNHPHDQLAARIPISGSYAGKKVGIWSAVTTLLQNAFIQALAPTLDEPMTLKKVEEKQQEKKVERSAPPPGKGGEKLTNPQQVGIAGSGGDKLK